jgi:hypothetical protein
MLFNHSFYLYAKFDFKFGVMNHTAEYLKNTEFDHYCFKNKRFESIAI